MTLYERFYEVVARIPRGRVATYGQVAALAGLPRHSRHVGYALAALTGDRVPWQRVINSRGEISSRDYPDAVRGQRARLEDEGVEFDGRGRVPLKKYQWKPR
ncbi:MAG: MGMT family protein [Elusimicrobiota bacterium]|nr:MAG: MGMT family protein [Elusimicrobiota bacterium]